MSYTRKSTSDVQFFACNAKRKRPIAGSTVATNQFLVWLHEERPNYTINQLRALLLDRRQFLPHPEALAVLDAYVKVGEGDVIPRWR